MGDFNLDGGENLRSDYSNRLLLNTLRDFATDLNLIQVVDFNTWSRTINGILKESMLDHVYLNNPATLHSVYYETPVFGDHVLVITELNFIKADVNKKCVLKRSWINYSPCVLKATMYPLIVTKLDIFINCTVQSFWNLLEHVIISATDIVAPIIEINESSKTKKKRNFIPPHIVAKLSKIKRFIHLDKSRKNNATLKILKNFLKILVKLLA